MPPIPATALPVIRLTDRQEAFCQAMACDVGGAEAARRAGYSAKGAKQRGALLMSQPEIRVRVQQLRANRRADHQTLLDEATVLVGDIITDAMEKKSCGLALRAIEFRLKLGGVIQDRRIAHHYNLDRRHPDADQEDLDCDPEEELDPLPQPAKAITPKAEALPSPIVTSVDDLTQAARIVTPVNDLSRVLTKPPAANSLFASTAMAALTPALTSTPAARFRLPVAA